MSTADEITELLPGIHRIRIPLRARVEPANAWLLRDGDGWTIFDTGVAPGILERVSAVLEPLGSSVSRITRIVVSHHHPDHIGGSGPLHRASGAPVLASGSTIEQAPDVWGDGGRIESYFESVRAHLHEHGFPDEVAARLVGEVDEARLGIDLAPPAAWHPLDEGDVLQIDGRAWRVMLTPGHADGQLVLHAPEESWLLAADHLLERISPAVGRFPRHHSDPLGSYLDSLARVAELDAVLVLPGHGTPFPDASARARVLVEHHAARVDACVTAVRELGSATAYDVAERVFHRVFEAAEPDPANQRFATTETLAHLERARVAGRLTRAREDDVASGRRLVRYEASSADVAVVASDPVR